MKYAINYLFLLIL